MLSDLKKCKFKARTGDTKHWCGACHSRRMNKDVEQEWCVTWQHLTCQVNAPGWHSSICTVPHGQHERSGSWLNCRRFAACTLSPCLGWLVPGSPINCDHEHNNFEFWESFWWFWACLTDLQSPTNCSQYPANCSEVRLACCSQECLGRADRTPISPFFPEPIHQKSRSVWLLWTPDSSPGKMRIAASCTVYTAVNLRLTADNDRENLCTQRLLFQL